MSTSECRAARGALARADLLRALAVAPRERLALDIDNGLWFGYVRLPEPPPTPEPPPLALPPAQAASTPSPAHRLPLRMPFAHAIVERHRRPPASPEAPPPAPGEAEAPLDEEAAQARSPCCLAAYEDLLPQARLLPALRRHLGATRAGALDLERIAQQLAARQLPRHLPRQRCQRWHPELVVVLDFCPRLWPYRHDMHRLAGWLLRHCGRSGVELRIINRGPGGAWSDWLAHQNPQAGGEPPEHDWRMPATGAPVLLVSDLGLLTGAGSAIRGDWRRFVARLRRAGLRPLALAPLGAAQLDPALAQALPILRWSPDARARPAPAHGAAQGEPAGLAELLAMAAATRRVDPPLLRALRRLNPRAPLDAGLEGAFWCHPEVDAGYAASLRPAAIEPHLRRFGQLLPTLQAAADRVRERHHAHLRAVVNHEETLLWAAHAGAGALAAAGAGQRIGEARQFLRRLGATLASPDSAATRARWLAVARDIVQRADAAMGAAQAEVLHPLLAALLRAFGERVAVPAWADPAALARLLGGSRPPLECWLVRDVASGGLLLQAQPAGARQSPLGEALRVDAGGVRLQIEHQGTRSARWLSPADLPQALGALAERSQIRLDTSAESVVLAPVERPRGAAGWQCGGHGLALTGPRLGGVDARWEESALRAVAGSSIPPAAAPARAWQLAAEAVGPPPAGSPLRFGIDPEFGLWAEFTVSSRHGSATQRLRWIEPGSFRMGSPESEPERYRDEGPQHWVTLTRGFWLAETACPQALWQTVMGANPSYFQGDSQRPVEQVSWHEVQGFLRALEKLLPGCEAALPTEAQWEYACRAGSETPFSFGGNITPEQVNYDGNHPYAGGAKGRNRGETVPVKSLPANAWGLYEMQGNVLEWCADGTRAYDEWAQQDPTGPVSGDEGAHRAVRGGSWIVRARGARSARRGAYLPGERYDVLGFRLSLRSLEPGQVPAPVQGRPGRPAAPGGRPPR